MFQRYQPCPGEQVQHSSRDATRDATRASLHLEDRGPYDHECGSATRDAGPRQEIVMNKCKKCGRSLNDCTACNGGRASGMFGKLTCSKCNNTGVVCNTHGGGWK